MCPMTTTRDLVPGVHRLGTWTVNWYLVEDGGRLTAVDAGLPGFRDSLETDLGAVGAGLADIEAVVLTHSDADHIGLASALKERGARVLIHTGDAETLRKPGAKGGDAKPINILPELWRPSFLRFIISMMRSGGGRIRGVDGAETFAHGDVLDVPGRPRVIPTPGHTKGHCAFHFEQHGALFVGDAMCAYNPVTGRRGPQLMPRPFNESNADALRSLDALEPVEAEVMLFGHGEPWRDGVGEAVRQARAAVS
jgi:glyoxylase-like metal-dependent hydrolase (beta-lactamase superfamily II)